MTDHNDNNEIDQELHSVLGKVTPKRPWSLSKKFLADLKGKVDSEMNVRVEPKKVEQGKVVRLNWRWPLAAAACLVAGIMIGQGTNSVVRRSSPDVAWGQVVEAVRKVPQFRVQSLREGELESAELYYAAPSSWRLHVTDQDREKTQEMVAFTDGGTTRAYDVNERAFLPGSDARTKYAFPNRDKLELFAKDPLQGVLQLVFDEKIPEAEPVKSGLEHVSRDIEVFDYAKSPTRRWARIWVLRQSRLPIRVEVFDPQGHGKHTLLIDYTDPMPKAFFDPAAFESEVKFHPPNNMRQAMQIGVPLADGKARFPEQVFDVQGGFKLPPVDRVVAFNERLIQIWTTDPGNRGKDGQWQPYSYDLAAIDEQGRTWLIAHCQGGTSMPSGVSGDILFYTPLDPAQVSTPPKQLTLTYTPRSHDPDQPAAPPLKNTVEIPPLDPAKRQESGFITPDRWRSAVLRHLQEVETPLRQLHWVEAQLALVPEDEALRVRQVKLLKALKDETQAWAVYRRHLHEKLLSSQLPDDREVNWDGMGLIVRYAEHLASQDRMDELMALSDQVAKISVAKRHRESWDAMRLDTLSKLPQLRSELEKEVPPKVRKALRSENGFVSWLIDFPEDPGPGDGDRRWGSLGSLKVTGEGWTTAGSTAAGNSVVLTGKWRGTGPMPEPSIRFEPALMPKDSKSFRHIRVPWMMKVSIPDAAVADQDATWRPLLAEILPAQAAAELTPRPKTPFDQLQAEFQAAMEGQNWLGAEELLRRILAAPLADRYMPPRVAEPDATLFRRQDHFHESLNLPTLLAHQNKWDEAFKAVDDLAGEVRATPDLDPAVTDEWLRRVERRRIDLVGMLADANPARAREWITAINARRPDFSQVPSSYVRVKKIGSVSTYNLRTELMGNWDALDAMEYRLEKIEGKR